MATQAETHRSQKRRRGAGPEVTRSSLGRAEWSGKRCIQSLKVSRREGYRKRHSVFLDVRWRAGFGNCDNAPAANDPAQRNRGGRATMDSADLRQRDRKSTRLNSSHLGISYAVFCLKKK